MNDIQKSSTNDIKKWFEEGGKDTLSKALGTGVDVEKYWRGVVTTIQTDKYRKLEKCTPESIIKSVLVSAQIGLTVDFKEHAFLIPRKNGDTGNLEATFMPGYKGYMYRLRQSEKVDAIYVEAVYKGDRFDVEKGTSPQIIHKPNLELDNKKENITHFYAVVKFKNGSFEFEVMTKHQIDEVRQKAATQSIWGPHFAEMGRKTVLLRLQKRLQLPETTELVKIDEAHHQGKVSIVENNEVVIKQRPEQIEENADADYGITEEKEKTIGDIKQLFNFIGMNGANRVATITNYCKVGNLSHAKKINLDVLHKVLKAKAQNNITK